MPRYSGEAEDEIKAKDSPSIDAFFRWRVSNPSTIFDSKQIYDDAPLFWDDIETVGAGTGSSHSTATASTTISVSNTTVGTRVRQTFMRFNYQPGKSQLVIMTGVLDASGGGTGISQRIGYFDDDNGLFFENDEGTVKVVVRTKTSGSVVNNKTTQASWNLDTMDGNGSSGITLDFTKTQIFIIDFEWLSVGRVRFGFIVAGKIIYCHQSLNANTLTVPYMSTPNLPLRYEIANDGNGGVATLNHICSTVIAEGGTEDLGILRYKSTGGTHVDANVADTIYALVGIKLKSTHVSCTVKLVSFSVVAETDDDFEWLIILNPTVAGVFTYGNETNSCIQTATGATANTVTGGTVIDGGFVNASKTGAGTAGELKNALRLGSKIDGTVDEIVLCVRPLSANADVQGSLTWRELV